MARKTGKKLTLLMIDDDADFTSDFLMLLEEYFECFSATDSDRGINIMRERSIDIILLDLMFDNGPNGIEILRKIKKEDPDLPVIMITDYASVDTVIEAMRNGAYDYVSKTPNLKELLLKIQKSIDLSILKRKTATLRELAIDKYRISGKARRLKN